MEEQAEFVYKRVNARQRHKYQHNKTRNNTNKISRAG